MLNYLVFRILAVILLVYYIIDLVMLLLGKFIEARAEKKSERARHYIEQDYSVELDNTETIDVKKEDEPMPEIPDNVAKKVSKAKKKME